MVQWANSFWECAGYEKEKKETKKDNPYKLNKAMASQLA